MFAIVAAFLFIGGACFSMIVIGDMVRAYGREIESVLKGRPMPGQRHEGLARGIGYAPRKVAEIPQPILPVRSQQMVRVLSARRASA